MKLIDWRQMIYAQANCLNQFAALSVFFFLYYNIFKTSFELQTHSPALIC